MIKIYVDSDCDFTPTICKKYGLELISMPYTLDDQDIFPYETWEEFDDKFFYGRLREGSVPKTFALNIPLYNKIFVPEFEAGNDVLYMHFSRAQSSSFDVLEKAIEEGDEEMGYPSFKKAFPDRKLIMADTANMSIGSMALVLDAKKLIDEGKSIEEVAKWVEENKDNYTAMFTVDNLDYLGRSGRVDKFGQVLGNLIGLRPVLTMGLNGRMVTIDKVIGRLSTYNKIIDYCAKAEIDTKHPIYITHADNENIMHKVEEMLRKRFGDIEIIESKLNPTCGCHTGPDTFGIAFRGKKII